MGWNALYPLDSTPVSSSPDQKKANFEAIYNWFTVEHNTFGTATSGSHDPGEVAVLYYGLDANILALTSPGTGSMAWATDTGEFKIRRNSWERLTEDAFSRVKNVATSATITNDTLTQITTWESATASGMYDTLDEWSSSQFTAKAEGFYLVQGYAKWYGDLTVSIRLLAVYVNGVQGPTDVKFGANTYQNYVNDVIYLAAGSSVKLYVSQVSGASNILESASINIQRVS